MFRHNTYLYYRVTAGGEFPNVLPKAQLHDCPVDSMYGCKRDGFLEPPCSLQNQLYPLALGITTINQ